MDNNPITNEKREKSQLYNVSDLYILTTHRKIRADYETTRYITECFVGIKDGDNYYEFFSNAKLHIRNAKELTEFNKPFIFIVEPLNQFLPTTTIEKEDIFNFIIDLNARDRSTLDIVD